MAAMPMLAVASDKANQLFGQVLPWLLLLMGVVLVGGVIIFMARRYMRGGDPGSGGFTLQDLRDLHAEGEITDEELERAKAQMIGRLKAPAEGATSSAEGTAAPGGARPTLRPVRPPQGLRPGNHEPAEE